MDQGAGTGYLKLPLGKAEELTVFFTKKTLLSPRKRDCPYVGTALIGWLVTQFQSLFYILGQLAPHTANDSGYRLQFGGLNP